MPGSKRRPRCGPLVERHAACCRSASVNVAAIGAPCQRGQNRARARRLRPPSPSGWHTKMRRRLGVSPTSRDLERAGQHHFVDVGITREVDRVRGASHVRLQPSGVERVRLLDERDANARGPALSGTRTVNRPSTSSPVIVGLSLDAAISLSPPNDARWTRSPFTEISSWCGILEATHRAEVGAEQPDLELVFAVERQRRAERAVRRPFRAAALRCDDPATRPAARGTLAHRRRVRIANRERADALRRGQVTLEQHGRERRARRRCCRSRRSNHPAGGATRRRDRRRAGRESRSRTRRD